MKAALVTLLIVIAPIILIWFWLVIKSFLKELKFILNDIKKTNTKDCVCIILIFIYMATFIWAFLASFLLTSKH